MLQFTNTFIAAVYQYGGQGENYVLMHDLKVPLGQLLFQALPSAIASERGSPRARVPSRGIGLVRLLQSLRADKSDDRTSFVALCACPR
jgi:hypothetical protein